jgi:coenzyme F420-0:L-glutamate ligase
MQVTAYKLRKILPPQDDLFAAILDLKMSLKEDDIVCISSKVVSIDEGRCVAIDQTLTPEQQSAAKENLVLSEADWFYKAPKTARWRSVFTISRGIMVGSAGIDESNSNGYYVLYPTDPFKSAKRIRAKLMKMYGIQKLAVLITDSTSVLLKRGAVGTALAWDGIDPLHDYRGSPDIFGRSFKIEMSNIVDSLAASAVLEMGEGSEQTPIAVIRNAKNISYKNRSKNKDQLMLEPDDDLFAPLFWQNGKGWKKRKEV